LATNSDLTSWIISLETAEAISKLKVVSASNQNLLQFVEEGIVVAGLPMLVADQVDTETVFWGIPQQHVVLLMRKGTAFERFPVRAAGRHRRPRRVASGTRVPERARCGSRTRRRVSRQNWGPGP
jgi:hypothetical protein